MAPTNLVNDEQSKLLEEAMTIVRNHAFQMKRCLDKQKLMDALKCASNMLAELKTSALTPKNYYELYMAVTDELRHLECFLLDEFRKGKKIADLYELVQFAGNIIPRLYLLITVGVVYIKVYEESKPDILRDLVEMCRGVQHPLRGLFLRNYLLQETRGILAGDDDDTEKVAASNEGGPREHEQAHLYPVQVQDTIEYVLLNFGEMNKLWVRMQHQGHTRERDKRERERLELKILVGTNLSILSHLDGVTQEKYIKSVLPSLLEQVVSCRDPIAQEYLMECIIQVFPDEFHLATLAPFLKACAELHADVNVKSVIVGLMDRLAMFAQKGDSEGIPSSIPLFDIFSEQISALSITRPHMPKEDMICLHVSLVNMALQCYNEKKELVDQALGSAENLLRPGESGHPRVQASTPLGKEVFRLLRIPIDSFKSTLDVFDLSNYKLVLATMDHIGRKNVSVYITNAIINKEQRIPQPKQVEALLDLISPLIVDQADAEPARFDEEDFVEEQGLVARVIHLFQAEQQESVTDTLQTQYQLIQSAKKCFGLGGRARCKYTLPSLVYEAFALARKLKANSDKDEKWGSKTEKIFQLSRSLIMGLVKSEHMDVSLRLFLQGAAWAARLQFPDHETVSYEFISTAVSIYEEELSDSKSQVAALSLIIGTVREMKCFCEENHATLRKQLASAKLLKKTDQSRVLCLVTHLFWSAETTESNGPLKRGGDVLKLLKKALKTAESCMDTTAQVQLHVEVLDSMLYFMEKGNKEITTEIVTKLLARIRQLMASFESGDEEEAELIQRHFKNTLAHIRFRISAEESDEMKTLLSEVNKGVVEGKDSEPAL